MSASSASWSRRAESRRAAVAWALGATLFALSWALLHGGFYDDRPIIDTPLYQTYGDRIADGQVPYRDFDLEYPPAALPAFVLPSLAAPGDYVRVFELLMLLCGAAACGFVALALARLEAPPLRLAAGAAFVGLAPLALGPVLLSRYDLWPAALTAGTVAALVAGRGRLALGVLAVAVAAKIYPLVLLPLALVHVGRRKGAREAALAAAIFAGVLAAILLPFALVAPDGLVDSLTRQTGRPLQIESLGGALLLAGHQLALYDATVVSNFGSQNLAGGLPDLLAALLVVLQALAVVAVWVVFARGRADEERLVAACAAAVVAFVAFGKVLSPQFLIWLLPLVPLVGGGLGLAAAGTLAAALVLTQLWFPSRYWEVVALGGEGWLVLLRDLALVALFALLLAASRRGRGSPRSA